DPNQLAAYITLAHMALARGDLEDAERQLRLAQRINPEHPHVLVLIGQLNGARGEHELALEQLTAATAAAPDDVLVLSSLAHAYLQRGNLAFAEQAYRRALEQDPGQYPLQRGLVESLRRQDRLEDASEVIGELHRAHPDDIGVMQLAGELAAVDGHIDQALDLFRAVIARDPHHLPAINGAAHIWVQYQGEVQAREFLDNLLEQHPDSLAAWDARFSLEAGNAANMFAQLQRWQAAMPEHPVPAERLAQAQDARGDVTNAEVLADIALAANPLSLPATMVKARAELHRDPALAVARLQRWAAHPDPTARRSVLGWLGFAFDPVVASGAVVVCAGD
ncbi:MAG: tetratricopeptide repeat protein, partial [Dokdonella sp.]